MTARTRSVTRAPIKQRWKREVYISGTDLGVSLRSLAGLIDGERLVRDLINAQHLNNDYEDSDAEVDGPQGLGCGNGGGRSDRFIS